MHTRTHNTYPVAKVFALCVRFVVGGAGGRAATMVRVRRGRGAGDDIRIGIPVQHIRLRAVLIRRVRATRDEALPGGRQRGHTSSHHHRGTVRSAVRPAAFMHHYTWYCKQNPPLTCVFPSRIRLTCPDFWREKEEEEKKNRISNIKFPLIRMYGNVCKMKRINFLERIRLRNESRFERRSEGEQRERKINKRERERRKIVSVNKHLLSRRAMC